MSMPPTRNTVNTLTTTHTSLKNYPELLEKTSKLTKKKEESLDTVWEDMELYKLPSEILKNIDLLVPSLPLLTPLNVPGDKKLSKTT